jgi:hypothetical protein
MSVKIKPGVEFAVVAPGGFLILQSLKAASKTLGIDLTITSGTDGAHSGPTDPHKTGEAYDVRSNDLAHEQKAQVLNAVMGELEMGRFYGFLEGMGTANEHFHFQRSKGTTFSVEDFLNA